MSCIRMMENVFVLTARAAFMVGLGCLLFGATACKSRDSAESDNKPREQSEDQPDDYFRAPAAAQAPMDGEFELDGLAMGGGGYAEEATIALDEGRMGKSDKAMRGRYAVEKPSAKKAKGKDRAPGGSKNEVESGGERGPETRAWFPETFLFEPLVVTDAAGTASLDVRVPDRLTTWRVLALAHSREGGQAGTVTSFLGTLPAYVDPVVPSLLRAGDRVRLPVQLVNTTADPVASTLVMEAAGATLAGGAGPVSIPGQSNIVRYATLATAAPGEVRVLARLGDTDSVLRTTRVVPTGRPVTHTQSGTLAAARQYSIASPQNANAALGSARLMVFPGALSILRSELGASLHRGGVADDAFALLLAGKAPELLRSLGDEPDADALRDLAILATQRVIRHARTLDSSRASLLADAALAHPDNPVLARLGKRAVDYLQQNQVPDGTCGGASGWTLQRLLVTTAECAAAARSAPQVGIRASGAFERHAKLIDDAYTAAAILASRSVSGKLADELREKVVAAVETRADGSKVIAVPKGVLRSDGRPPSAVEAAALAVLALDGQADSAALIADLGAAVLAGYSPTYGWGDGRANLVCMQAVLRLFKDPIPERVDIVLSMDGEPVAEGQLTRDKVREVLTLEAGGLGAAGAHEWQVRAEPAVPGLGFSLTLENYVPWDKQSVNQGLELAVTPPSAATVGMPAEVAVQAVAPSGQQIRIELSWPAGVQVDTATLDKLVAQETISRYNAADGKLELFVDSLAPAQVLTANIRVIPTLAGTLHSGPSSIRVGQVSVFQPPAAWTVAAPR
jgi:hypothetical protein